MSRRIYLGRLPPDVTRRDVEKHIEGYGQIIDCRILGGYGFLEMGSERDAEDVIKTFNGKPLMGQEIIVEAAKENTRRKDTYETAPPRGPPKGGRGIRVLVKGISNQVSWQDLKDFGREGGPVTFADVDRRDPGNGILEYPTMADAEEAVARLSTLEIRGDRPVVVIDDSPPSAAPAPSYRDDFRRPRDPRDDYGRRDRSPPPRHYEDRRRDYRDRSPPRHYDDRRRDYRDRSPPPPRRERSPPPRRERSPPRGPPRDDYRRDDRRDDRDRVERAPVERAPATRAAPLRGEDSY